MVTRESIREEGKKLGWEINEPYQVYTAPWNAEGYVLMDDHGDDLIILLRDAELEGTANEHILRTNMLPDESKAIVYVDGYGHRLEATVKRRS